MQSFKKAIDVLGFAIQSVFLLDKWKLMWGRVGKPGEVIQSLSEEEREALTALKSDELDQLEVPAAPYYCDEFYQNRKFNKEVSNDKLAFDQKMKK